MNLPPGSPTEPTISTSAQGRLLQSRTLRRSSLTEKPQFWGALMTCRASGKIPANPSVMQRTSQSAASRAARIRHPLGLVGVAQAVFHVPTRTVDDGPKDPVSCLCSESATLVPPMQWAVTFSGGGETYAAVGSDSEALPVYVIGRGRPKPTGRLTFPACLRFMSSARERYPLKRRSEAWVVRNIGRIDPQTPSSSAKCASCPAHHLAAERVQHRRQLQETLLGRHVGDVRHRQSIRRRGLETPLHPLRCHRRFPPSRDSSLCLHKQAHGSTKTQHR